MDPKNVLPFLGVLLFSVLVASQDMNEVDMAEQAAELAKDPCYRYTCKKPSYALCISKEVDGELIPVCECPDSCPDVLEPVCSVYGKQYDSKCHLRKYACKRKRSYPLAYEEPCVASQDPCEDEELKSFPYRLLEWFLHLYEISELEGLDPNSNIRQISAAEREKIAKWKFDLLDRKHDGFLDRRDLREFRYSLMPLEHCANDFFHVCFQREPTISLERWIECLGVHTVREVFKQPLAEVFLNVVPAKETAEDE